VFEAIDGVEALELIQGQPAAVEVVVSDIVTALSKLGIVAPCSILTKPFSAERLLAEVDRCIPRPDGGSSAA
jgi:DNA-binding LytR/AlgR family response regulator